MLNIHIVQRHNCVTSLLSFPTSGYFFCPPVLGFSLSQLHPAGQEIFLLGISYSGRDFGLSLPSARPILSATAKASLQILVNLATDRNK